MDLVVIGSGMYVSGRQTKRLWYDFAFCNRIPKRKGMISSIKVVGTSSNRAKEAQRKYNQLSKNTSVKLPISFYPKDTDNIFEYKKLSMS